MTKRTGNLIGPVVAVLLLLMGVRVLGLVGSTSLPLANVNQDNGNAYNGGGQPYGYHRGPHLTDLLDLDSTQDVRWQSIRMAARMRFEKVQENPRLTEPQRQQEFESIRLSSFDQLRPYLDTPQKLKLDELIAQFRSR